MWNSAQAVLFQKTFKGMSALGDLAVESVALNEILNRNRECFKYESLMGPDISQVSTEIIDEACQFVFEEFATVIQTKEINTRWKPASRIEEKLEALANEHNIESPELEEALSVHSSLLREMKRGPVDCMFLTGVTTEFKAIVRRMDAFAMGTHPGATRGFMDSKLRSLDCGWVKGHISDGTRKAKVVAVCGSRYGPLDATAAAMLMVKAFRPRYLIVAGICGSLRNPEDFALGDVGYSNSVVDICLGKHETVQDVMTEIIIESQDIGQIPAHLEDFVSVSAGKLAFKGVPSADDIAELANVIVNPKDRRQITELPELARRNAERTNLHANALAIPHADHQARRKNLDDIIQATKLVQGRGDWVKGIKLPRPGGGEMVPRVVSGLALSGSSVVKQDGMRNYLKSTFGSALLVEMEAAGAARGCGDELMPFVLKSACDWATPKKEKAWQPYCADVAAAFAIDLALELAN